MEVWFRDRYIMEEGYEGNIWECLWWLAHEKGECMVLAFGGLLEVTS